MPAMQQADVGGGGCWIMTLFGVGKLSLPCNTLQQLHICHLIRLSAFLLLCCSASTVPGILQQNRPIGAGIGLNAGATA